MSLIRCTQDEMDPANPYLGLETIVTVDNYPARLGVYTNYGASPDSNDVEFYIRLIDHPQFENLVIGDIDTSLIKILFYQSFDLNHTKEEVDQRYEELVERNADSAYDFEFDALFQFQSPFLLNGDYEDLMVFYVSGEIKARSDDFYQKALDAHPFVLSEIEKKSECQVNSEGRKILTELLTDHRYRLEGMDYQGEFYFPTCEKNEFILSFLTDSVELEEYDDGKDWRRMKIPYKECKSELYYFDEDKIYIKPYYPHCTMNAEPFSRDELLFDEKVQNIFSGNALEYHIADNYLFITNPNTGDQLKLFSE